MSPNVATHAASDSGWKVADVASTVGAGIVGGGLGVLVADYVAGLGMPVVVLGLALHAWGMRAKHALESGAAPLWVSVLYWSCWVIIVALAVYALARMAGA